MSPRDQEDSLASLEDRIQKAVQLVARLRQEKEAAERKASELSDELKALQAERQQVRDRIEKLLGTIDQLSAG